MIVAFDTETNGVDLHHGCGPFFISTSDEDGNQRYWEWDVDPLTRRVDVPPEDVETILEMLAEADRIQGQNIRFDVHAMCAVDPRFEDWDWAKTDDTMIEAHLLDSNGLKDLTTLCVRYLDVDVSGYEKALGDAVKKARHYVKRPDFVEEYGSWKVADEGDPDLPSAKGESPWRNDYWLPKAMYDRVDWIRDDHPKWETVLRDYALADTAVLPSLVRVMRSITEERGLLPQLKSRMEILPVLWRMERNGVTVIRKNLDHLTEKYERVRKETGDRCLAIAAGQGFDLQLPKGASPNDSVRSFLFDVLDVPRVYSKKAKSSAPTLDKDAMAHYLEVLPEDGVALDFVKTILRKRKVDTSLSYMESYRRFGVPIKGKRDATHIRRDHADPRSPQRQVRNGVLLGPEGRSAPGQALGPVRGQGKYGISEYFRLHPSINPVGTTVTRRSSSTPNEQNISDKRDQDGLSLRYAFGPAPGREWWSMDYENIELRLPAYEAGEQLMIDLFENPDAAPYYGSNHLLCAHILWPREFDECLRTGESFKDKYQTLYKRTKNGNFAVQYGAMESSGTADRAYGQVGAQRKIQERLGKINDLNKQQIDHANRYGFVWTMPDKTVDPERGYPVQCPRTERGGVKPTVPLSYHVQGTAGWCTGKALIRCSTQIEEWNRGFGRRNWWIVMEVHDELVFDFPIGGRRNLPKVRKLKYLMERSGDDVGVPLKVDVSYHPSNWAEEVEL